MSEFTVVLSHRGRVTIPAEIRQRLGLRGGDQLTFVVEDDGRIEVKVAGHSDIGGAGSLVKPMSWEQIREIAREDRFDAKHANSAD